MPERVVVPLERRDIDQADGAPVPALLERQERFELLDEAPEVHQPRLRIAVDAIGEVGDQLLEVAGDAADRGVARGELLAHPVHALGKAGRDRLYGFLLGLLPQPFVVHEHAVDGVEQRLLVGRRQREPFPHPLVQFRSRSRDRFRHPTASALCIRIFEFLEFIPVASGVSRT